MDHDCGNKICIPFWILNHTSDRLDLDFTESKIMADLMVDAIETHWQQEFMKNPRLDTLVLYSDIGPENSSHHTQYIKSLIEFSVNYQVKVILCDGIPFFEAFLYKQIVRIFYLSVCATSDFYYIFLNNLFTQVKRSQQKFLQLQINQQNFCTFCKKKHLYKTIVK